MFMISLVGLMSYFNNRNVKSLWHMWRKQSKRLDNIIDDINENESRNYSDSNRYVYGVYQKNNNFTELKQPSRNNHFKPLEEVNNVTQEYNMMRQYTDIYKNNTYTQIN